MRDMTLSDVAAVCAIEQQVQSQPWTQGNLAMLCVAVIVVWSMKLIAKLSAMRC
jgi:hypothetical protein